MLYKIIGKPISIVRFKLNWSKSRIVCLDYRTSKKDFKIVSSFDNGNDTPIINLIGQHDGRSINVSAGSNALMKISEYKLLFENRVNGRKMPSLEIVKNLKEKPTTIDIPFGDYEMQVPLPERCNAVFYTDHVSIFNKDGSEIAKYYIEDDGIYEITPDQAIFTYLSKADGRSSGLFSVDHFINHSNIMPSLRYITPIAKLPTRLFIDDELNTRVDMWYDMYGLMNKITNSDDIQCYYTEEYSKNGLRIRESVHHLVYDNFDMANHFYNTRMGVAESIKIDDSNKILEYIGVTFDNVEKIIDVSDYLFREQIDFDATVEECFKY